MDKKKKVLFIGVSNYHLDKPEDQLYLKKKFEGLSREIAPLVLAKGKPFHTKIWKTEFYLLPPVFFFWFMALKLAFWLAWRKKIDVIVAQSPLAEGFVGSILKKTLKKELIVEVHGDWEAGRPRLKKFLSILARFSFKNADKIRAISAFTLKKARALAPGKPYFVFPTFTDIDDFLKEEIGRVENFILFVGNLQKVKGIDILLEAFAQISKDFPDFKLILIGEGPEKEKLKVKSQKLKIIDKVDFKGRLSLEQTRKIMKNCYGLVLPSRSEGLGRVLMEAMALQKPVIGSRVGGIPDLIKDGRNGFLFEAGDAGQLAEKLRILLTHKNRALEMGKRGREFIRANFSNQNYINHYLKMLTP